MTSTQQSVALNALGRHDFVAIETVPVPVGVELTATEWVSRVFDVHHSPIWVKALFGLREAVVPFLGIARGTPDTFAVREVSQGEALLLTREAHLDFAAGLVQRDRELRLTTVAQLHNTRGRFYFAPVRVLHRPLALAMLRRAVRQAAA